MSADAADMLASEWLRAIEGGESTWRRQIDTETRGQDSSNGRSISIGLSVACRLGAIDAADALIRAGASEIVWKVACGGPPLSAQRGSELARVFMALSASTRELPAAAAICAWGTTEQFHSLMRMGSTRLDDALRVAFELGRTDMVNACFEHRIQATKLNDYNRILRMILERGNIDLCRALLRGMPRAIHSLCRHSCKARQHAALLRELMLLSAGSPYRPTLMRSALQGAHMDLVRELLPATQNLNRQDPKTCAPRQLQRNAARARLLFFDACFGGHAPLIRAMWRRLDPPNRRLAIQFRPLRMLFMSFTDRKAVELVRAARALLQCGASCCPYLIRLLSKHPSEGAHMVAIAILVLCIRPSALVESADSDAAALQAAIGRAAGVEAASLRCAPSLGLHASRRLLGIDASPRNRA